MKLPTGLTFLVGKSKIGKSWLALDIAMQVNAGRPVFGKISDWSNAMCSTSPSRTTLTV